MFVSVSVTPLRLDSGRARVVEEFDGRCPPREDDGSLLEGQS